VHVSWYPGYVELIERLAALVPELGMGYLCNSGTEAVEAALKLAKFVTCRPGIIAFHGSFHGRTLGAASVTGKASLRRHYEPLLPSIYHVPYPWCFRCSYGKERSDCNLECYMALEELFETDIRPEETAAVLIEPILGEGGYYISPDEFLLRLRMLCDRHGIMLIVDEVQSGMGRTGKMFAWQHINGFIPDAMTLAKGLGSGFPIGALMAKPEIMRRWEQGAHGSTFGGNPVSCAAALATLDIFEEEGLTEKAVEIGAVICQGLERIRETTSGICDIRGRGMMLAIEFTNPDGSPDINRVKAIIRMAVEKGLILIGGGLRGNVLRIVPPLIINKVQALEGLQLLAECVRATDG
jgi:4-aminobutyrate aminotransferase